VTEIDLTHSRAERKRFDLGAVGSLRYEGLFANRAVATAADGTTWRFGPAGARGVEAKGAGGAVVGAYDAGDPRNGRLTWAGRALVVRPVRGRRARWTLHDEEGAELAALEGRGTGARPATITLPDAPEPLDPGLLLFLAFLVRKLAKLRTAGLGSH
jgi:hypothetical protein